MRHKSLLVGSLLVAFASQAALGNVLFEDTFYWVPTAPGALTVNVVVNPPAPPTGAYAKIQETVFDDPQGKSVVSAGLGNGLIHGSVIPPNPIHLYVYSITNLAYANGPSGMGNGISGFNIVNAFNASNLGMWGSNAAASWWDTPAGNTPFPQNFEWDIDADMDTLDGDGTGILQGFTFDGFMYAVPEGTPHGFLPAWIHTWTGGEQPAGVQVDITSGGFVSGPVPEPASVALLLVGVAWALRRRT